MFASFVCLSRAALLLLSALCVAPPAAPPVSVTVRIMSGPWGGPEYSIAHGTLTVFEIPSIRAASQAAKQVFKTPLPTDAASRRLQALDPATY